MGLRGEGFDVEKLRDTGARDEGDHVVRMDDGTRIVIEAKAGKMHPLGFVREAAVEARHYAEHRSMDVASVKGIAVVKAPGQNWKDAYVLTTVRAYFGIES